MKYLFLILLTGCSESNDLDTKEIYVSKFVEKFTDLEGGHKIVCYKYLSGGISCLDLGKK